MPILSKINLKRYFSLSVPLTCVCFLMVSLQEALGIIVAYAATLLNQWILLYVSISWPDAQRDFNKARHRKIRVLFYFIGKFVVLLAAMCFCMHFMEKKAIIPLANYVLHIFILFIALKKEQ